MTIPRNVIKWIRQFLQEAESASKATNTESSNFYYAPNLDDYIQQITNTNFNSANNLVGTRIFIGQGEEYVLQPSDTWYNVVNRVKAIDTQNATLTTSDVVTGTLDAYSLKSDTQLHDYGTILSRTGTGIDFSVAIFDLYSHIPSTPLYFKRFAVGMNNVAIFGGALMTTGAIFLAKDEFDTTGHIYNSTYDSALSGAFTLGGSAIQKFAPGAWKSLALPCYLSAAYTSWQSMSPEEQKSTDKGDFVLKQVSSSPPDNTNLRQDPNGHVREFVTFGGGDDAPVYTFPKMWQDFAGGLKSLWDAIKSGPPTAPAGEYTYPHAIPDWWQLGPPTSMTKPGDAAGDHAAGTDARGYE